MPLFRPELTADFVLELCEQSLFQSQVGLQVGDLPCASRVELLIELHDMPHTQVGAVFEDVHIRRNGGDDGDQRAIGQGQEDVL